MSGCQEAAELSSLKPQLDELGVPLYAVVKEDVGTEVQNFRPYFKGEIFLDEKVDSVKSVSLRHTRVFQTPWRIRNREDLCLFLVLQRRFYGPRERKMGLLAFLRVGVWMNGLRAFKKGFMGNVFGEGFVLGAVFVIGRGQQVRGLDLLSGCIANVSF